MGLEGGDHVLLESHLKPRDVKMPIAVNNPANSLLQHCHTFTVHCGLMDIRTNGLFLSGYKFPLTSPSTLYTPPT